jgi:hypothetical protein
VSEPLFHLAAAPKAQVQVPTLTRASGVRQFLEQPPYARWSGWNLITLERAELAPGPRLHIQNGKRKFFDLYADGAFTAIGTFDGFLGVGRWDFSQRPKINGLAIVEFTHEFVSFYERLLHEYVDPLPDEVRFTIGIRNAHFEQEGAERRLQLSPGPVGDLYELDQHVRREAPDPAFNESFDVATVPAEPHLDVGRVSYELLRRFFNRFGFEDEAVPYTNEEHDAIDFVQIQNMRQ